MKVRVWYTLKIKLGKCNEILQILILRVYGAAVAVRSGVLSSKRRIGSLILLLFSHLLKCPWARQ